VQDNKYKLDVLDLYVFNIFIDDTQMDHGQLEFNCLFAGLKHVPEVWINCLPSTIPLAVETAKGQSVLNPAIPREGLVMRNYTKNLSFKIVNPEFLIKYNE
jgi:hypothetical protein